MPRDDLISCGERAGGRHMVRELSSSMRWRMLTLCCLQLELVTASHEIHV